MVNTLDYVEKLFTPSGFANPHPILARMPKRYEDSNDIIWNDTLLLHGKKSMPVQF